LLADGRCALRGGEAKTYTGAACSVLVEASFVENVWGKVAVHQCLKCHKTGGDAEESDFVLRDPARLPEPERDAAMRHNRAAFEAMARVAAGDESRLLLKAQGKLKHEGEEVLAPGSAGCRILAEFVKRVTAPATAPEEIAEDKNAPPFFSGIAMLDDRRLLRRATLSLAGRLPTDDELARVAKDGAKALPAILNGVMHEDAFFDRLREAFNDIFLTLGLDGNADATVLAYEHFEKTRLWF
jgi:hypothetical protein